MFENLKREWEIRKALKLIKKQRAIIKFDDEVYAIENSPAHLGWFRVAVTTAQFRGWAEEIFRAIPEEALKRTGDGGMISPKLEDLKPHYRLTEGGWAALHRTHNWTLATFFVSLLALVATLWPRGC